MGRPPHVQGAVRRPMIAWDLSCPDWEDRLRAHRIPIRDNLPIDPTEGDRAVAIFKKLRLADVPGTPTMAEAGDEWIFAIVRALFGSLDPVTKMRAIRELFLLVPKKNSKTTYGALIMVTALLLNERPNAPFIMTAPVQDVAELAYEAARGAIELDPVLGKKFHVRDHLKTITHRETKAALQIMTCDPPAARRDAAVPGGLPGLHHHAERGGARRRLPFRAHEGPPDPRREAGRRDAAGALRVPGGDAEGPRRLARSRELAHGHAQRGSVDHDRAPRGGVRRGGFIRRGRAARVGVPAPEHRDRPRASQRLVGRRRVLGGLQP